MLQIKISPRFVRQDKDGLRPFQKATLEAIKDSNTKLIFVEAPVGAGKSYIIRTLLSMKEFERRPLILTYPTKILMETQVAALETEMGQNNLGVWPSRDFVKGKANLILYNSDSLIRAVQLSKFDPSQGRGDLLRKLFFQLAAWAKRGAIVTSPDVLWLLYGVKVYDEANDIQNKLTGSVAVFDEFHLYGDLANFPKLVDTLLLKNVDKVVLLSATPYTSSGLKEVADRFPIKRIDFEETSETDECGKIFNYSLDVSVQTFKTTDVNQMAERIIPLIKNLPKPMAIICESVFRLEHLRRRLQREAIENVKLAVWSGMEKDRSLMLDNQTVLLGTSAIEVGIDFRFESLIFEAQVWTSAVQRLGRVGRHSSGIVVMMTRKTDVETLIGGRTEFGRTQFEREILFEALNDPRAEHETGHSFRGQNYNFLLIDQELRKHFIYHERLFCLYDVDDSYYEGDWQNLGDSEKEKALREFGIPQSEWKELIIRDKLLPFWGIVRGRLRRDKYFFANDMFYYPNPDRNELHVLKPKRFVFTGKDFEA